MTVGLSSKLRMIRPGVYLHWCPGCKIGHTFDIHELSSNGHVVGWDGDINAPSVGEPLRYKKGEAVCEYELRAGLLTFYSSCTHELAGKIVNLPDYPI